MTRHSARCWALPLGVLLAAALLLMVPIRPPSRSAISTNWYADRILWNIGRHRDNPTIALGRQFEEIATKVRKLYNSASANDHVEVVEAMLGRLEPIERAIMATPARTVAGLGVKARYAAYVMSEYWDAPIDKIDWDARAVRLLIEAVCESTGLTLPFRGDDEKTPAADWPLPM